MKFRNKTRLNSLLSIVGLAVPMYARFVDGDSGSGGSGGSGGPAGAAGAAGAQGTQGAEGSDAAQGAAGAQGAEEPKVNKAHLDAAMKDLVRIKAEKAELERRLKDAPSPAEVQELREARVQKQKEEEEAKKRAGQFEELLAKQKKEAADAIAAEKSRTASVTTKYQRSMVVNALSQEIPKFTTAPVADVLALIQGPVSYDPETEKFKIEVNGVWPVNDKGRDMTLEEFVEAEVAKRPYLATAKPAQGSGGTTQRGGKGGEAKRFTADEVRTMSDAEFKKNEKAILEQGVAA